MNFIQKSLLSKRLPLCPRGRALSQEKYVKIWGIKYFEIAETAIAYEKW